MKVVTMLTFKSNLYKTFKSNLSKTNLIFLYSKKYSLASYSSPQNDTHVASSNNKKMSNTTCS